MADHYVELSGEEMHIILRALLEDADMCDGERYVSSDYEEVHALYDRLWSIAKEQSVENEHLLAGRLLQELDHRKAERETVETQRVVVLVGGDRSEFARTAEACLLATNDRYGYE